MTSGEYMPNLDLEVNSHVLTIRNLR